MLVCTFFTFRCKETLGTVTYVSKILGVLLLFQMYCLFIVVDRYLYVDYIESGGGWREGFFLASGDIRCWKSDYNFW
jgi:hypothetical protein